MDFKSCTIIDKKITTKEDGTTYISGYANIKGVVGIVTGKIGRAHV